MFEISNLILELCNFLKKQYNNIEKQFLKFTLI